MLSTRLFFILVMVSFGSRLNAEKPAEVPEKEVIKPSEIQTVEKALEWRAAGEEEAAAALEAAKIKFVERLGDVDKMVVRALDLIGRRAIAKGDIAIASQAWGEVLRLDKENATALKFFEVVGNNPIEEAESSEDLDEEMKEKEILFTRFLCANGREFAMKADGSWSDSFHGQRKFREVERSDGTVVIENVLGDRYRHLLTPNRELFQTIKDRSIGLWREEASGKWVE